jgi:hypothetical protein
VALIATGVGAGAGLAGLAMSGAGIGGLLGVGTGVLSQGLDNGWGNINYNSVAIDGIIGMITGAAFSYGAGAIGGRLAMIGGRTAFSAGARMTITGGRIAKNTSRLSKISLTSDAFSYVFDYLGEQGKMNKKVAKGLSLISGTIGIVTGVGGSIKFLLTNTTAPTTRFARVIFKDLIFSPVFSLGMMIKKNS